MTGKVFSQTQKLISKDSYYPISRQICEYLKQTGKLEIERNDSLRYSRYRTDSSEMILYESNILGFLVDIDSINEANKIYLRLDSLVSLLFKNGLLTSDLIIKSFCTESKYIDYKGDTLDWTNHVQTKTVKILNIQKKRLPNYYKYKDKNKIVYYEIWVTFDEYEDGWGSFPMFDLVIKSDIKYSNSKIKEFLKSAKIKCLRYTATQI
jgi:hypothetical protein